jgi:hypothetical protein
MPILQGSS